MKTLLAIVTIGGLLTAQFATACPDATGADALRMQNKSGSKFANYEPAKHRRANGDSSPKGASRLQISKEEIYTYYRMRKEADIPCLRPLITNYQALSKATILYPTTRNGVQARIALRKVGNGQHPTVLVCVHGIMGDGQSWRYVAGALGTNYNLWLVDLLGCGDSDAPHPAHLGADAYSPSDLADRLLQAVTASLAECPPETQVVFVGHSFGGLVTLRAFMDPDLRARHAALLGRVQGLVLLAPCDVVMNKADPHFEDLSKLSGTKVALADGLGIIRELTAKYLLDSSTSGWCTPREEVDNALHAVCDNDHRHAFQTMLGKALPFDPVTHRPMWPEMEKLESWYQNVNIPCRIIWGERDETLPVTMGYKMAAQLPHASLTIVPGGMHSPVYECPQLCARLIREAATEFTTRQPALGLVQSRSYRLETIQP